MIEITVNGDCITANVGLQDNATMDDLAQSLLNDFFSKFNQKGVITQIITDGYIQNEFYGPDFLKKSPDHFKSINFIIKSPLQLAQDAIDSSPAYIDQIHNQINHLIETYKGNKAQNVPLLFLELIDNLDLFIQLVKNTFEVIREQSQFIHLLKERSEMELEGKLLSILKSLLVARKNNDWIMICDLLEYELKGNLNQWKTFLFYKLKSEME